MMQERVCIVLNEREPNKARVAEGLTARLKEYNITASRVKIDQNVTEVILERRPKIIVLDYLLGDYSTGLDVLSALNSLEEAIRPRVIFLTDEPSIKAAVEAMRLGAHDYLEIDNPESVARVAREIYELNRCASSPFPSESDSRPGLEDIVAHSAKSQALIRQARVLAVRQAPLIVIHGACGTGRNTLAYAILSERTSRNAQRHVDLATFDDTPDTLFRPSSETRLSWIITGTEHDDGSVLSYVSDNSSRILMVPNCLIACTTSDLALNAWKRLPHAEVLTIPPLVERMEDIPHLAQQFARVALEACDLKFKPLSGSILTWLSGLAWPGEVKQLRAVISNAVIDSTLAEVDLRESIEQQLKLWESACHDVPNPSLAIDGYTAALALELADFNYRIAAARLGCSMRTLRELIR